MIDELRIEPWFSARFAALRLLVTLSAVLPLQWLALRLGHGVLGLGVLLVALWPYRYHLTVNAEGLDVRWLFLRARIPAGAIASARVEPDPRRWVLGTRLPVLRVRRHAGRGFFVFGARNELCALEAALEPASRGEPVP